MSLKYVKNEEMKNISLDESSLLEILMLTIQDFRCEIPEVDPPDDFEDEEEKKFFLSKYRLPAGMYIKQLEQLRLKPHEVLERVLSVLHKGEEISFLGDEEKELLKLSKNEKKVIALGAGGFFISYKEKDFYVIFYRKDVALFIEKLLELF